MSGKPQERAVHTPESCFVSLTSQWPSWSLPGTRAMGRIVAGGWVVSTVVLVILNYSFLIESSRPQAIWHDENPPITAQHSSKRGQVIKSRTGQGRFTSSELSGFRKVTYSPLHVLTSYSCCSGWGGVLLIHSLPKTHPGLCPGLGALSPPW